MSEKLIIVKTLADLESLMFYLSDKEWIAFDTETDGVDKESRIIGYSVCAESGVAYYVVNSYWDVNQKKLVDLETTELAFEFMARLIGKKLIMQNAPFDCARVYDNYRIDLMPSVHTDTMILAHIVDENRQVGLKELGVSIFGQDARKEQEEMKESVYRNGGVLTKELYELYKADADLIGYYGAKDAILTYDLFWILVEQLMEQGLDGFFYDDESMPLLRGPTYDMNTTGLRVDPEALQRLKNTLETECLADKGFIHKEIEQHVNDKYKGTNPRNTFNIGASQQLAWLLFERLDNEFNVLTDTGKEMCEALSLRVPYTKAAKREFIRIVEQNKGRVWAPAGFNKKTKKPTRPKVVGDYWKYLSCGKASIQKYAHKYVWCEKLLIYKKNLKLLNTYVEGIQQKMRYGIIRPSFLQHGTTSGRYSSRKPNFQNLPRDDKRVKSCIIARPGKVFVGADYSQLEPRVFASLSGDERLLKCFKDGEDFYSVIGAEIFDKRGCSLKKSDPNSFAKLYPDLRQIAKTVALAAAYGTTAHKMAIELKCSTEEAQEIIDMYFAKFPKVKQLMLDSHKMAKETGKVVNIFGRPRRMPAAMLIEKTYGRAKHADLPYEARNILNLSVNHRSQSSGASIMNRAAIMVVDVRTELAKENPLWNEVKVILQVHDELILEGPEALKDEMKRILKTCMETAVELPGVDLIADPVAAYNLGDLKAA